MYVHYVTGEACQAMPRDLEFTRSIGSPLADVRQPLERHAMAVCTLFVAACMLTGHLILV